jgi:ubiquinone/menaquinone biosynthesis C-methylase UbiE
MNDGPSFGEGYQDFDESAEALLRYLDEVASVPAMASAKRDATAALELQRGDRVLEIGCGTGVDLAALAEAVGDIGAVIGVEPNAAVRAAASRRAAALVNVTVCDGTAEDLPLADASVSAVRMDRTFQHVKDPSSALSEIRRVLRPKGRLVILEVALKLEGEAKTRVQEDLQNLFRQDQAWLPLMLPVLLKRSGFDRVELATTEQLVTDPREVSALVRCRPCASAELARAEAQADDVAISVTALIFVTRSTPPG